MLFNALNSKFLKFGKYEILCLDILKPKVEARMVSISTLVENVP